MKFTPEIIAALETLKNAAENDFERHRINVLEKDLISPPKVEIIDEKHQKFNGVVYYRVKSGHYTANYFAIHRTIWNYYNGDPPKGYEIHHIDENPANNEISNLQLLTRSEHQRIHRHGKAIPNNVEEYYVCSNCGRGFKSKKLANLKYCSAKCKREAEKRNGKDYKESRHCIICGQEFFCRRDKPTKTCSNHCNVILGNRTRKRNRLEKLQQIKDIRNA